MAQGSGGVPGFPSQTNMTGPNIFDNLKQSQAAINTAMNPQNIFDLIKRGYSQQMTSVLPYVQQQFAETSKSIAPQIAGIKETGEIGAAMAQSEAGARGLRGSDIEAAGMAGSRIEAGKRESEFRGQIAQQEAQFMAGKIFESFGFDIQQNQQLFTNLASAIGQELSQHREIEMFEKQLKLAKKQLKENSKNSLLNSLIQGVGSIASGYLGGGGKFTGVGNILSSIGGGIAGLFKGSQKNNTEIDMSGGRPTGYPL